MWLQVQTNMGKRRADQISCEDERKPQVKRFKLAVAESQLDTIYEQETEEHSDDSDTRTVQFDENRFHSLLLVARPSINHTLDQRKKSIAENLDMGRRLSSLILTAEVTM